MRQHDGEILVVDICHLLVPLGDVVGKRRIVHVELGDIDVKIALLDLGEEGVERLGVEGKLRPQMRLQADCLDRCAALHQPVEAGQQVLPPCQPHLVVALRLRLVEDEDGLGVGGARGLEAARHIVRAERAEERPLLISRDVALAEARGLVDDVPGYDAAAIVPHHGLNELVDEAGHLVVRQVADPGRIVFAVAPDQRMAVHRDLARRREVENAVGAAVVVAVGARMHAPGLEIVLRRDDTHRALVEPEIARREEARRDLAAEGDALAGRERGQRIGRLRRLRERRRHR